MKQAVMCLLSVISRKMHCIDGNIFLPAKSAIPSGALSRHVDKC
jgi:hypothetical protein